MTKTTAKLTLQDWLKAGLTLLGHEGEKALTLESLCRATKRTKGSFYHHFKNHNDFVEALLQYWRAEHTIRVIQAVEQLPTPEARRKGLDRLAASLDSQVERAVRRWAGVDERAAATLAQVDQQRIEYLTTLIMELGQPNKADAYELAVVEYAYFVGIQHLFPDAEPQWIEKLSDRLTSLISTTE